MPENKSKSRPQLLHQPNEDFISENNYRIRLNYNYLENNNSSSGSLSKAVDLASKHSKYSNEIMNQQQQQPQHHHEQNYSSNIGINFCFVRKRRKTTFTKLEFI